MLQGHYELRGAVERAVCPRGRDGVLRTFRRPSSRPMLSIVGPLDVPRLCADEHSICQRNPRPCATAGPVILSTTTKESAAKSSGRSHRRATTTRRLTRSDAGPVSVDSSTITTAKLLEPEPAATRFRTARGALH
jgi:hypothetical protein